jgi:hypothetical protein
MSTFRAQYSTISETPYPFILDFDTAGLPTLVRGDLILDSRHSQLTLCKIAQNT